MESKTDLSSTLAKIFDDTNDKFEKHPNVTCSGCQLKSFVGYRYMCLECKECNLCENCYEDDKNTEDHKINHLLLLIMKNLTEEESKILKDTLADVDNAAQKLKNVKFFGSNCNYCQKGKNPEEVYITGPLIKCDECFNYNLCWECYKGQKYNDKHKIEHKAVANLVAFRTKLDIETDLKKEKIVLGKGHFGSVSEAYFTTTNKAVALKTLISNDKNQVNEKTFYAELRAYSEILSSKILRYYGYCIVNSGKEKKFYIVTELMCNGTILDYLSGKKTLPSLRRRFQWLFEIIRGVARIHKKGFVHKDIKPDNLLISNVGTVKIGDMGVACNSKDANGFFKEYLAPKFYSAPEIIDLSPFTESADIYSFGLVMNYLFSEVEHKRPFDKEVEFPKKADFFYKLVRKCVNDDPLERPTAKQIIGMFSKFETHFWSKVSAKKFQTFNDDEKNFVFADVYLKAKELPEFNFL